MLFDWLGPQILAAQPVQSLQAQINAVEGDPQREDVLRMVGSASGQEFSGFRVEFGVGEFPETWKVLVQSSQPVNDGLLAEWKTRELASGIYALRLTVKGLGGQSLSDRTVVKLQALRPDLVISGLEARVQGPQVAITSTVENRGKHPVRKPISMDFYLSLNQTLDSSTVHLGERRLSGIEAGGSSSLEANLVISPQVRNGGYSLLAKVDHKGEVVEADEENNLAIAHGKIILSPDLVVAELKPALVREGQQVSISGKIKNQGNRPSGGAFVLALFLSSDGSIDDRDLRVPGQKVEGLEAGSVISINLNFPLPETLEPGNYFILAQVDPEGKVYEWEKSNNTYWGSSFTLGPDLVISGLSASFSKDGGQMVISDSLKNQGRHPVKNPFKITYYLSSNDSLSSQDQILGRREVPSLSAGEVSSASTPFAISSIPKGTYTLVARVDVEKAIMEMTRANNEFRGNKLEIGPDLSITSLTTTLLPNGEQIEIRDTIKNQGNLALGDPFRMAFYLSLNEGLDDSDRLLGSRSINGLDVGAESIGVTLLMLPPKTEPGGAFVLAKIDPDGLIGEVQRANNIASAGRILKTDVDLNVGQLAVTLTSNGERMVFTDTVKNLGPQDIPGPFSVGFYLSKDGIIDPTDLLVGERRVEGLRGGLSSSGTTPLIVPAGAGVGKLSVLARVDSRNEVVERKENNNDYWGSSLHLGPDLIFTEIKVEVAPDAHEIATTQVVRNQGNRPALGGFKVAAYLSKNTQLKPENHLLGRQSISSLEAGGVMTVRSIFPLPPSLENGRYTLLGRVDPDQEAGEVEEGNNDRAGGELLLGPDLVVEAIKSALAPEGEQITVEDTVRNQGNRPTTGNLQVSYFLSRNWSIDGSDTLLGNRIISNLGAGEQSAATTLLTIRKKKVSTGRYFVLARVDAENTVIEADEANNVRPTLVPLIIRQEKEKKN